MRNDEYDRNVRAELGRVEQNRWTHTSAVEYLREPRMEWHDALPDQGGDRNQHHPNRLDSWVSRTRPDEEEDADTEHQRGRAQICRDKTPLILMTGQGGHKHP